MKIPASYSYLHELHKSGKHLVVGIDEVGRGALAGPLVAGAVILPQDCTLELFDSKVLSAKKRTQLASCIQDSSIAYGLGWVSNTEIDSKGIAWALQTAYERALEELAVEFHHIVLDGNVNYLASYECCEIISQADAKVATVAAASILAKVARDEYMHSLGGVHLKYGYETNAGYGTVSHREAICKHGLSDLHRSSFCTNIIKNPLDVSRG